MKKLVLALLVVGCLVAADGCKRAAEKMAAKAIERSSGGKVNVDISASGTATIPEGFPKDVLVPQDAKIVISAKVPEGFVVTMQSKELLDAVVKKYGAEMKTHGWTEQASVNMGDSVMLSYAKEKEGRTASVMVAKTDKGTQLQVTVVKDKNFKPSPATDSAKADEEEAK